MLRGACDKGRKPEHETLHFPCKVDAAGDERYLVCAAVAAGVVSVANVFLGCSATGGCVKVRSSIRFLNLWLRIALEWLHDCCHLVLPCA